MNSPVPLEQSAARSRTLTEQRPQVPTAGAEWVERYRRATEHKPTVIYHSDRDGKPWRFSLSCTEARAENLKRVLVGFRTLGNAQACTIAGALNADDDAKFYGELETLFLSGLSRLYTQQPVEASTPQRTANEPRETAEEPRAKYWWQND